MFLIILSFVGIIRLFLIIAIFALVIRWISKLFSPRYSESYRESNFQSHSDEGKTTIQFHKQEKKNSNKEKGEYVDFEELK